MCVCVCVSGRHLQKSGISGNAYAIAGFPILPRHLQKLVQGVNFKKLGHFAIDEVLKNLLKTVQLFGVHASRRVGEIEPSSPFRQLGERRKLKKASSFVDFLKMVVFIKRPSFLKFMPCTKLVKLNQGHNVEISDVDIQKVDATTSIFITSKCYKVDIPKALKCNKVNINKVNIHNIDMYNVKML